MRTEKSGIHQLRNLADNLGGLTVNKNYINISNMELLTVKEVASVLKVNVHKVYELIRAGLLPAMKLGSLKVRRESLYDFLAKYEGKDLDNLTNIRELNS